MIARRESLLLFWLSTDISKGILRQGLKQLLFRMSKRRYHEPRASLLLYNITLSNCITVGIRPDFKGSPAGSGLRTWQSEHTPQGRVETRTFSVGGLHYSNTGVPYNGRPWPTSVTHVCNSLHILAHIPIRVTHMHTQGSCAILNSSYFYLWFVCWSEVRSGTLESGCHLQWAEQSWTWGSGARASELQKGQNQTWARGQGAGFSFELWDSWFCSWTRWLM